MMSLYIEERSKKPCTHTMPLKSIEEGENVKFIKENIRYLSNTFCPFFLLSYLYEDNCPYIININDFFFFQIN